MRVRTGVVGIGLMVLSAVITSSASTKVAEARSVADDAPANAVSTSESATLPTASAPAPSAYERAQAPSAEPREVITPPPADLRLENPKLRRLQKHEVTPALLLLASSIVRRHYAKPVGTTVATDIEGKRVVARIERHFHPEGGPVKPWGYHPGVSLFVAR